MKKAVIYVFSGTGNTLAAAKMLKASLEGYGYLSDIFEVRVPFSDAPDPRRYDIALFGYPIHAFNAPSFFLKFVKTLPEARGTPAYFFKTSGEPFRLNGASSYLIYKALAKRGFEPMLDTHMLMPYNVMFRYPDPLAKQMYAHTEGMCAVMARRIAEGERDALRYPIFLRGFSCAFRIQWFGAWINGPLQFASKKRCSGCGKCAMECPSGNIKMENGRPRFGWKCIMCMRCAMRCPCDAVKAGFLNPWRVNGPYDFKAINEDRSIPDVFVCDGTKGYFSLFRKYYRRTNAEIAAEKEDRRERAM